MYIHICTHVYTYMHTPISTHTSPHMPLVRTIWRTLTNAASDSQVLCRKYSRTSVSREKIQQPDLLTMRVWSSCAGEEAEQRSKATPAEQ